MINLSDFEAAVRGRLSPMAHAYMAGGGGDEISLRRNRERLDALLLAPRVFRDVSAIDTHCELLGRSHPFPILLAPTGFQKLFHPDGEIATARGSGAAGATYIASTASTTAIESIGAAATGALWFQLYVQRDRGFTRALVERAEGTGVEAIVVTGDTPVLGSRDRERRVDMALPPELSLENLRDLMPPEDHAAPFHRELYNPFLDPSVTWETVSWVRSFAKVPVLIKGVLVREDARRAVEEGLAGILVSNHGGRNLDTVPSTIEALSGAVEAVAGRVPVLVDGGIRRGTDVVKALALGATAVLIGRPYLWGLTLDGADGVRQVVEILHRELVRAMALLGVKRLAEIDRGVLWRSEG